MMPTQEEFKQVSGNAALTWVAEQNQRTEQHLYSNPLFATLSRRSLELLSTAKPTPELHDDTHYRCFCKTAKNKRGVLCEITKDSYQSKNPHWKPILDIDALAEADRRDWKYGEMTEEEFRGKPHALVTLSDGGSDAHEIFEFDLSTQTRIRGGFYIPKAKSEVEWHNRNTILVATDFGSDSLTHSGYPRSIRLLKRGEPLDSAESVFEIPTNHLKVSIQKFSDDYQFFEDTIDFYRSTYFLVCGTQYQRLFRLPIPEDAELLGVFQDFVLLHLQSDWKISDRMHFKTDSLIHFDLASFKQNPSLPIEALKPQLIYQADEQSAILSVDSNDHAIFITTTQRSGDELLICRPKLHYFEIEKLPFDPLHQIEVTSIANGHDEVIMTTESYLTPKTIYRFHSRHNTLEILQKDIPFFDASSFQVLQREAISRDGTPVPYIMIARKNCVFDSANPTLLYGYGGFGDAERPKYLGLNGTNLLERGFVYVKAMIRGGGEFGTHWTKAAICENKQKSFEDFIAVAVDLIHTNVTQPRFLGIQGSSNGGLLVGACVVHRPDLFGAVVCEVPLLDMQNYHKLFAGHSWIAEYGNPDNARMKRIIQRYSPLQNIKPDVQYPPMFIQTSSTDDRVHPYHARITAQTLQSYDNPVTFYEDKNGGHSWGVHLMDVAQNHTRDHIFLYEHLLEPALRYRSSIAARPAGLFAGNRRRHERDESAEQDVSQVFKAKGEALRNDGLHG